MHSLEKILKFLRRETKLLVERIKTIAKGIHIPDIQLPPIPLPAINLSKDQSEHLYNLAALLLPYIIVSAIVYPKLSWSQLSQEVFSLLCIYLAIYFWFMDKIADISRYRIVVGVTACAAPIIFINNSFAVALVSFGLIIFAEFVCAEYLRGCFLFSSRIPIYVVCDGSVEAELIKSFFSRKYKILKLITLENGEQKAIEKLRRKLTRFNRLSFFPFPRRILYFPKENNARILSELTNISADFSLPLFKVGLRNSELFLAPISIKDFDAITISPQEKEMLQEVFASKRVWIFYDGRKSVFDLICALSDVADLTIFCESDYLMQEVEIEFSKKSSEKKHRIKIADKNLFSNIDMKPDVLFFNMPLLHLGSSEDNLKEAFVKNVFNVSEIVETAQKLKIKFVFMLSTVGAFNTNDWAGATQRLGELVVQCIDSVRKRTQTKFRIIRLPDCITDFSGIFERITSAVVSGDKVVLPSESDSRDGFHNRYYSRNDVIHPLIKLISFSLKEHYVSADIYSIFPENTANNAEGILNTVCNSFYLRKGEDIKFDYTFNNDIDTEEILVAFKSLEKSDIASGIMRTKFSMTSLKYYDIPTWTIDQINKMSTRDVISAVFQSLKEKKSDSANHA